jgi:hypothetical protein
MRVNGGNVLAIMLVAVPLLAQEPQLMPEMAETAAKEPAGNLLPSAEKLYIVEAQTSIPLVLVNSVSTKNSQVGDPVYLQTSFPIAAGGRIVIPEGSYVTGTITQVTRPGRIKGRGEMYIRFDTLMLHNGVQRDFRARVSAVDGSQTDLVEREGSIKGDSTKAQDAITVAGMTVPGAMIGGIAGNVKGAAIGSGIGAVVGMATVLLTRGSEVQLLRGTALVMELDRDLTFTEEEILFVGSRQPSQYPSPPRRRHGGSLQRQNPAPFPRIPFPF